MGEFKCPECNVKLKLIGGDIESWHFICSKCGRKSKIKDDGFGYLPMRVQVMKERYP